MRKLFLSALLLCMAVSITAQITDTRLWEISHPDLKYKSYLIGTVHSGYEGLFDMNDSMFWALDQSGLVAFELDNEDISISATTKAMSSSREMSYLMLECILELLPKYKNKNIDTLVSRYSNGMKTFYNKDEVTERGTNARSMVFDDFLTAYARYKNKEVEGIETAGDQLKVLFSFNKPQLTDIIENFFNKTSRFSTNMDNDSIVFFAARNQSVEICNAFDVYTSHPIWGSYYKRILDDRNIGMANYVLKNSKKESMTCAVGLGHMCGRMGIISLLEKEGYTVRPISISTSERTQRPINWTNYKNKLFTTQVPYGIDTVPERISYLGLTGFNRFQKKQKNIYVDPKGAVWFEYFIESSYADRDYDEVVGDATEEESLETSLANYIEGTSDNPIRREEEKIKRMQEVLEAAAEEAISAEEISEEGANDDLANEEEKKEYASRFVEFWAKVNEKRLSDRGSIYGALDEEDKLKKDTLSLGKGFGDYVVTYSDDVIFEYVLPGNEDVTLRIRGDENIMKRQELLDYFRKAKAIKTK